MSGAPTVFTACPASPPLWDVMTATASKWICLTRNTVPNGGRNGVGQRSVNCLTHDRSKRTGPMTKLSHPAAGAATQRRIRRKTTGTVQPRTLGYGRVSTADQHPEVQGAALECAGCSAVFLEQISSRKAHRPQLEAVLAALRPGDTLAVVRLDRLARNLRELLELTAQLEERGIALQVLEQGIDTSTPTGRLMLQLLGAIAQFERDLAAERLSESIRYRRANGGDLGGRRPSWNRAQHRRGLELQREGWSIRRIAAELNLSRSVVERMLKLPIPQEVGE